MGHFLKRVYPPLSTGQVEPISFKCTKCGKLFTFALHSETELESQECVADSKKGITRKEFWLKLFNENDTALATAIHLCTRYVDEATLDRGAQFIAQKRNELYEIISEEQIEEIFGKQAK